MKIELPNGAEVRINTFRDGLVNLIVGAEDEYGYGGSQTARVEMSPDDAHRVADVLRAAC